MTTTFRLPSPTTGLVFTVENSGDELVYIQADGIASGAPLAPGDEIVLDYTKPHEPKIETTLALDRIMKAAAAIDVHKHILRFFKYDHLPPALQEVSKRFAKLAAFIMGLPRTPERTVALRKLLESKDAAVRTRVP